MDGASGVLAVVSLAIQLMDIIQEIRHFAQKVSHASAKHQSLIPQLNSLEILLEGVKDVSKRDAYNGATMFSESIRYAVINCDEKLKTLQQFIKQNRSATDGKGKISRTLGAVKLAFKDEDIKEINSSLHQAVAFLTAALELSARDAQYRNSNNIMSALHTVIDELVLLRSDVIPRKQSIELETGADEQTNHARDYKSQSGYSLQASRRKTNIVTCHKNFLGTLLVRQVETTVSFDADHEHRRHAAHTQIKTNWSILPSFLSRYIDFQFQSTSRSVFRNLRVYNVIDDKDPVWSICCAEDGRTLRSYLDNNRDKIDPFVVDNLENSLFHAAALCKNHETCKVLLELGVDPTSVLNVDGRDALYRLQPFFWPACPEKGIMPELTFRLVVAHFPDCIEGSVFQFWDTLTIEKFEILTETWVTQENINLFNDSPLVCAMRSIVWKSPPWPTKLRWIKSIHKLIKMGADVHRFSKASKVSLLHEVLGLAEQPYAVPEAFNFWLLALGSSGINVTRYLKVEVDFYYDNTPIFIQALDEARRILTLKIHDDGSRGVHFGWEWWLEPHSPGYELVKEFNELSAVVYYDKRLPYSDDYDFDLYQQLRDERRHYHQLREERFWSKKAAKAAKAKRKQDANPTRLPGAWID